MKKPHKNILDTLIQSLENDSTLSDATKKTYWTDLAVILRAVLANNDNETLLQWVHSQGYHGNSYVSVLNRLRKITEQEKSVKNAPET